MFMFMCNKLVCDQPPATHNEVKEKNEGSPLSSLPPAPLPHLPPR